MFVDCRAAFDWVDRGKLVRTMRERGVREDLVRRCEMLRETKGRVRVGEREFTLLLADLEEKMRGRGGGVRLGTEKICTRYANDVALMSEDEEGMKGLMARLERYVEEKGLEINTSKTKIMRCRRGEKGGNR